MALNKYSNIPLAIKYAICDLISDVNYCSWAICV